jgi:hypothetical protein
VKGERIMTSLRTDLRLSDSIVSVRKRAGDAHLSEPISVRKLANEMSPEVIRILSRVLQAGDVHGSATVAIASNGAYSFTGLLHTKRVLFGDKFTLVVALNHVDASGKAVAFRQKGKFESAGILSEATTTIDWNITGDDNWIENNWAAVKSAGVTFRLFASWNVTVVDILKAVFIGGAVTVIFLTGGSAKKGCWTKDDVGNVVYRTPCE